MAFDSVKREIKRLMTDKPGNRFANHAERVEEQSRRARVINATIGGVSVVAGMAMLVLPGPGGLVIAFGVAMIAGNSRGLAQKLDKAEVSMRRRLQPEKS